MEEPRYLVPFHPKRASHHFVDVLIIGGGLAGLRAAMEVDAALSVLVVTKEKIRQSSSSWAQGGIAGVVGPEDRFELHIEDTIAAGRGLCDADVVEMVIREAPERINELIALGTHFDLQSGHLALGREGGHSHHRIVHANGDATGKEVMRAVIDWTAKLKSVETWEDTFTLDLLTHEGRCHGAMVWREQYGKTMVWAKQTILCTGGAGQLYRETSNPPVATGDGAAICYRAGLPLRDLEFMQFHPTMLYIAGSSRRLITEAVRGEGAYLIDKDGYRFMGDYDERKELAPRDVVSQAIVAQMEKTQHSSVYLTLAHLDPEMVVTRFPSLAKVCSKFGLDITHDKIPVRPGAHYFIGGVVVDSAGRTALPGLWAAGEVTASGLHGANRLASNSLLEGLVFGAHAGRGASAEALQMPDVYQALPITNDDREQPDEPLDLADIRNSLKSLMWRKVSVRRNAGELHEARHMVDHWCRYVLTRQFPDPEGWELQNMLSVARLMIEAALAREETRGVHYRSDFPELDDQHWRRRLTFVGDSTLEPNGRP
ncbi:MAG: L-aspartate oxidase [Pirellulales bacterium]